MINLRVLCLGIMLSGSLLHGASNQAKRIGQGLNLPLSANSNFSEVPRVRKVININFIDKGFGTDGLDKINFHEILNIPTDIVLMVWIGKPMINGQFATFYYIQGNNQQGKDTTWGLSPLDIEIINAKKVLVEAKKRGDLNVICEKYITLSKSNRTDHQEGFNCVFGLTDNSRRFNHGIGTDLQKYKLLLNILKYGLNFDPSEFRPATEFEGFKKADLLFEEDINKLKSIYTKHLIDYLNWYKGLIKKDKFLSEDLLTQGTEILRLSQVDLHSEQCFPSLGSGGAASTAGVPLEQPAWHGRGGGAAPRFAWPKQ